MITFLDVMEKALTGKPVLPRDYELRIYSKNLREKVKEYDIKYDGEELVPADNGLAKDVFNAAFEFFVETGAYCVDTGRVIKFSEEEVKEELRKAPKKVYFGEGNDRKALMPRKPEDKQSPWCFLGAAGGPVSSEAIFLALMEGYASIPETNSITTPALTNVNGMRIRPRSPLEVLGAIRNAVLAREGMRRVGRPGIPIMNTLSTAESAVSLAAALHPKYGLRQSDGFMIGVLDPMKVDFDRLNKACTIMSFGAPIDIDFSPMVGGYAGGPEGSAVSTVAHHFLGSLVFKAVYFSPFPLHIWHVCNTTPDLIWVNSVYTQAVSLNTNFLTIPLVYVAAGPHTDMVLYETAASVISPIVSGGHIEAVGVAKNKHEDYFTPLEPKFAAEIAYSVLGMKRTDANVIVKEILKKYSDKIKNAPLGKKFQECYDIKRVKPAKSYIKIYESVKRELSDIGIEWYK